MTKAAIVLDDWKLPIFRKNLADAGFEYMDAGEFSPGTTILHVETQEMNRLAALLKKCEQECKGIRK